MIRKKQEILRESGLLKDRSTGRNRIIRFFRLRKETGEKRRRRMRLKGW